MRIDKSILTNLLALALVICGLLMRGEARDVVLNTGLFALSGGITNWLAVHMLFEKVPGFYGSGVIPARFEEFKGGIKKLVMEQFFNPDNIRGFFRKLDNKPSGSEEPEQTLAGIDKIIDAVDLNQAFESLVDVIMNSSFGGMLGMLGGRDALKPLQEPFVEKMRLFLKQVSEDRELLEDFKTASTEVLMSRLDEIVDQRLDELTPQLVKEIIQDMIKTHLGWLVVWGGVLGGILGFTSALFIL